MRNVRRMGLALLVALALSSTPVFAQDAAPRVGLNASVGPSFANVGTTFNTTAAVDYRLAPRTSVVGEFGIMPRAPFTQAAEIAAPVTPSGPSDVRVNAYHWNGNVKVQPFLWRSVEPYVTGGVGVFNADTIIDNQWAAGGRFQDRRRVSDFSTNLGAGLLYRVNDWIGLTADYRTFFVHRDNDTPRVNRVTTGLTLSFR